MNVENNGRRELAQWKVAMPVGSESHPPLLRTRLLVELLESPFPINTATISEIYFGICSNRQPWANRLSPLSGRPPRALPGLKRRGNPRSAKMATSSRWACCKRPEPVDADKQAGLSAAPRPPRRFSAPKSAAGHPVLARLEVCEKKVPRGCSPDLRDAIV